MDFLWSMATQTASVPVSYFWSPFNVCITAPLFCHSTLQPHGHAHLLLFQRKPKDSNVSMLESSNSPRAPRYFATIERWLFFVEEDLITWHFTRRRPEKTGPESNLWSGQVAFDSPDFRLNSIIPHQFHSKWRGKSDLGSLMAPEIALPHHATL